MDFSKIKKDTIFAICSICCLLYMKLYEKVLYLRHINSIIDVTYTFLAIPLFYYFFSACIMKVIMSICGLELRAQVKEGIKIVCILIAIIYLFLLILTALGMTRLGTFNFIAPRWLLFIIWGCLTAFATSNV